MVPRTHSLRLLLPSPPDARQVLPPACTGAYPFELEAALLSCALGTLIAVCVGYTCGAAGSLTRLVLGRIGMSAVVILCERRRAVDERGREDGGGEREHVGNLSEAHPTPHPHCRSPQTPSSRPSRWASSTARTRRSRPRPSVRSTAAAAYMCRPAPCPWTRACSRPTPSSSAGRAATRPWVRRGGWWGGGGSSCGS